MPRGHRYRPDSLRLTSDNLGFKQRLAKARARRDARERPHLDDNMVLSFAGYVTGKPEPLNKLTPRIPELPKVGTMRRAVLDLLHERAATAAEIQRLMGTQPNTKNANARDAITSLRKLGWWIENDGQNRFCLVPVATYRPAASTRGAERKHRARKAA